MEKPVAIANFFIKKSLDTGVEITPMKLIKLVYIAHGWYLALTGEPLLPEAVEAWPYGPVVPSIYHEFKRYGKGPITSMALDYSYMHYPVPTDMEMVKFLAKIWQVYGGYSALQLSALTHEANTPWDVTWNQYGGKNKREVPISNDMIRNYYLEKMTSQAPHDGN